MASRTSVPISLGVAAVALVAAASVRVHAGDAPPILRAFANPTGQIRTVTTGSPDTDNPFFRSLGTNGRRCVTCHDPEDGWSITPSHLQRRFAANQSDPVFRPADGATCPSDDVSTSAARRDAYRLLLAKGLIRVEMPVPANAEFTVTAMDDPYGCSDSSKLSLYRRPLPSTNLRFLSAVMWDGRESEPGRSLYGNLFSQAHDATMGHAQASVEPSTADLDAIVRFELGLHTAQSRDDDAGPLDAEHADGGPAALLQQPFFIGINDPLGMNPSGTPFDQRAFTLFAAWSDTGTPGVSAARQAIARGEEIFNTRTFSVTDVPGLTNVTGPLNVTCTTCHDTPNVGNHSVSIPLDIGVSRAANRTPDLPLYTLTCDDGRVVNTSDPGRAMVTGRCDDIGKVKGPILRGLAARAPYFHNGSAATLREAVDFYDQHFGIGFSEQDKRDLVAFLRSL
ncbi:MAG TPA: hypothetical protein VL173_00120 [Vicinamibacterales bacterium]|nr:hypothetical protein [Vicinamibacterales bacterium]